MIRLTQKIKDGIRDYAGDFVGGHGKYIDCVGYVVHWDGQMLSNEDTCALADTLAKRMEKVGSVRLMIRNAIDSALPVHRSMTITAKDDWVFMRLVVACEILEATGHINDTYTNRDQLSIKLTTDELKQWDELQRVVFECEISAFENVRVENGNG